MKRLAHLMPHLPLEGWVIVAGLAFCALASIEAVVRWPGAVVVVPAIWGVACLFSVFWKGRA